MMVNGMKNIFTTHIHKDDDGISKLKDLLKVKGMTFRNYSITSDIPNNAKDENCIKSKILGPRINQCSALVVHITPEAKNKCSTNWVIENAHDKIKRKIYALWAYGHMVKKITIFLTH